jgi:hypothetical protein
LNETTFSHGTESDDLAWLTALHTLTLLFPVRILFSSKLYCDFKIVFSTNDRSELFVVFLSE